MEDFEERPSPNHDSRGEAPIDILLLHYTGMVDPDAALTRLCDPQAKVSCHWFVHEDGRIVSLVPEHRRAWHAGVSHWAGESGVNARSIGIEIQNPGHEWGYRPFPDAQIRAVIALCRDILGRHPIPPERVLGHSDVAPARKEDPGELFPWRTLHEHGVGLWVEPEPVEGEGARALDPRETARLLRGLRSLGYGIPAEGDPPGEVVRAFQRHWRTGRFDGVADLSTLRTLERLLAVRK